MDVFEGKNKRYCKRLTKFGRNIVLRIKPRAAMFVVRFANSSLARYLTKPSSDCVIARAKGPVRAQASYGNITVLSLLKWYSIARIIFSLYTPWTVHIYNYLTLVRSPFSLGCFEHATYLCFTNLYVTF